MRLLVILVAAFSIALLSAPALADEAPLYEQEPYDTIKLDDANRSAELKVLPLDLPNRIVPAHPKPTDELEIHLIDRPKKTYRVAWESIVSVTLFEQRVLDEAERLVEAKKLDEAFPYYEFLTRRYPKMPALAASYDKFLMGSAREAFKGEKFDECLALASDLYIRNPESPGAAVAILRAAEKLIDRRFAEEDFMGARLLIEQTAERLKDTAAPLVTACNDKLHTKSTALVAEAKQQVTSKHYAEASRAVRLALAAWPEVAGAHELEAEIQSKYPEIVVGVTALAPSEAAAASNNVFQGWDRRRVARLLTRSLVEVARVGPQGPVYTSPLAKITQGDGGRRIEIEVNREIRWSDRKRSLTAADLAEALLAQGNSTDRAFRPEWRDLLSGMRIEDANKLRFELQRPIAGLESRLEIPIGGAADMAATSSLSLGPYRLATTDAKEMGFAAVEGYFAAEPKQPKQIVERLYRDGDSAVQALRRGEISVVDRVGPWEAAALGGSEKYVVERYGLPSLHLIVPNLRRPAMQNGLVRRAFAHAIDRSAILLEQLSRGRLPPGCELADGVLSLAKAETAAPASGAEFRFDGAAAKLLASLAASESSRADRASNDHSSNLAGELVLAYPPDEIARFACRAIEQQARAAGISLTLKEVASRDLAAASLDADLVYVPWTPVEPPVGLPDLIGRRGIGGDAGPLVERLLNDALIAEPNQLAKRENRLAQAIRDEMLVIPLWRLANFVVYDRALSGVGKQPVTLYQNVEHWQLLAPKAGE